MFKIIYLILLITCFSCIETKVSVSINPIGASAQDQSIGGCQVDTCLENSLFDHLISLDHQNQSIVDSQMNDMAGDLSFIQRCGLNEEKCNEFDDDCDGKIDENQACGKLLAQHCELTVGWTDYPIIGVEQIDHWPRNTTDSLSAGCPQEQPSQLINHYLETTCGKTGKDQQFHPITFFGRVDHTDRLGFHFQCSASETLTMDEKEMVSWVDQHCAVAIGYQPEATDIFPDFSECTSGVSSANQGIPRCVKTRNDTPRTFSILDLEGSVDPNDSFAMMFACDDQQPIRAEKIEKSIELFMGFYLIHHPSDVDLDVGCAPYYFDPIYPYLQCPNQLNDRFTSVDNESTMLCFGSQQSKSWGKAILGTDKSFVGHCDQMLIGLFPAIQR
jgi:hypothetical protein